MKHNLKLLGLCLALVLLCAGLFAGAALADGPDSELTIRLSASCVKPGESLKVTYDNPDAPEGSAYSLAIERLKDGESEDATPSEGISQEGKTFTVPADALGEYGRGYRAIVSEKVDGEEKRVAEREFVVASDSDGYEVRLTVNGEAEDLNVELNRFVGIRVEAEGAQRLWICQGDHGEVDFSDADMRNVEFSRFWDWPHEGIVYARAEYRVPYTNKTVSVVSNPLYVKVDSTQESSLAAPTLTVAKSTVKRGEPLKIKLTKPQLPENLGWFRLLVFVREANGHWVYDDMFDGNETEVEIPTATLEGDYKLCAYYRAIGYDHEQAEAIDVKVTASTEPAFTVDKTEVITEEGFVLSGYWPGKKGVCIFQGDEPIESRGGEEDEEDAIVCGRSIDRQGDTTFTLGYWDDAAKDWRMSDKTVTVKVTANRVMPDIGLKVSLNGSDQPLETGALVNQNDRLQIRLVLPNLANTDIDPGEVHYDVFLEDVTYWDRLFEIDGNAEDFSEGGRIAVIELPEGDHRFDPEHEYVITAQAHCRGCEVNEKRFRFVAVKGGVQEACTFTLNYAEKRDGEKDWNGEAIIPNREMVLTIHTPGDATAVELYHHNHWERNWDIDVKSEDDGKTWTWDGLCLSYPGEHTLMIRASSDGLDEDGDYDPNEMNWRYVSKPLTVSVTEGSGPALAPEIELNTRSLKRGEFLQVRLLPEYNAENKAEIEKILHTLSGVDLEVQRKEGEDDWEHVYDEWRSDRDIANEEGWNWEFGIGTMEIGPGLYRVILHVDGEEGYQSNETWPENPDYTFEVQDAEAEAGLMAFGYRVEEAGQGGSAYTVPTCGTYFISGYCKDDVGLALFDGEERVGDWEENAFTWRADWDDEPAHHVYTIAKWDDERHDWGDALATVTVDSVLDKDAPVLSTPEIAAPDALPVEGEFTFSFPKVEGAESYYAEVRVDGLEDRVLYWDSIMEDELPKGVAFDGNKFVITANLSDRKIHDEIRAGDTCQIHVRAYKLGSRSTYDNVRVPAVSDEAQESLVTVEAISHSDDGRFYVNRGFDVKVTTTKPDVTAIQVFMDGGWRSWIVDGDECKRVDESVFVMETGIGETGKQFLRARVTDCDDVYHDDFDWDEIRNWSEPSKVCEVEFVSKGSVDLPTVTLGEDKDDLVAGDMLKITFGALKAEDKDHVDGTIIKVYDAEGDHDWDEREDLTIEPFPNGGEFSLSTANLWPGTYCLHVGLDAPCYSSDWTDRQDRSLWFTVNPAEGKPSIAVTLPDGTVKKIDDKTAEADKVISVTTGDGIMLTGVVPGHRGGIRLFWDEENHGWTSDGRQTVSFTNEFWFTGENTFRLEAWDGVDEKWDEVPGCSVRIKAQAIDDKALKEPEITIEKTTADKNPAYEIRTDFDNAAEKWFIHVYHEGDWGDSRWHFSSDEDDEPNVVIPLEDLTVGDRYTVFAWSAAKGYAGCCNEKSFVAVGDSSEDFTIALSVNGKSDAAELLGGTDYPINIRITPKAGEYKKPTFIQLFWKDHWDGDGDLWPENDEVDGYDKPDGHTFERWISGGRYTAVVRASWHHFDPDVDWENFNWDEFDWDQVKWAYSNTVEVNVQSDGEVSLPDEYYATRNGDVVTVHMSGFDGMRAEGSEELYVSVYRDDADVDWEFFSEKVTVPKKGEGDVREIEIDLTKVYRWYDDEDGQHTDVRALDPGTYRVEIFVPGYEAMEPSWVVVKGDGVPFTIPGTIKVMTKQGGEWKPYDGSDINTGDELRIEATTPSGVSYRFNEFDDCEPRDDGKLDYETCLWTEGDHTFYLSRLNMEEDEWVSVDDPRVTVHVKAPKGSLEAPEITVPDSISADKKQISFSFKKVEDAQYYDVWIGEEGPQFREDLYSDGFSETNLPTEGHARDGENPASGGVTYKDGVFTVTFDLGEYTLDEGNSIRFAVWAAADGYNGCESNRSIPVVGRQAEDESPWLTINGKSDALEVKARQNVTLRVAIPKKKFDDGKWYSPVEVQYYKEMWEGFDEDDVRFDESDNQVFAFERSDYNDFDGGEYIFQVRATWDREGDENRKWFYGNTVKVTATKDGELVIPTITLKGGESVDGQRRFRRGQPLELSFGSVPEHVLGYNVRIFPEGGDDDCFYGDYSVADTVYVPTNSLEEGRSYYAAVWFEPEAGYDGFWTGDDDDFDLSFRVVQGGDRFTVDKPTVQTRETFTLSAYIPGADNLRMVRLDDPEDQRDSDGDESLSWNYMMNRKGEYEFRLDEWKDGRWKKLEREGIENPVKVTVKADKGALEQPVVSLPATLTKAFDGRFTVTTQTEPDVPFVSIGVWEPDAEDNVWEHGRTKEREFTLPMDRLEEGKTYVMGVFVSATGYDSCYEEFVFDVVREADPLVMPTLTLTVEGKSDETVEAVSGKDYTVAFKLTPASGKTKDDYKVNSLQIKWDNDWRDLDKDGDGFWYEGDEWSEGGRFTMRDDSIVRKIVVRAWIEGEEEPVLSNTVTLAVKATGKLPAPTEATLGGDYLEEDNRIEQGRKLTVTVTLPENKDGNHRDLVTGIDLEIFGRDDDGDYWDYRGDMRTHIDVSADRNTYTGYVSTAGLEPGFYRLNAMVTGAEGYDSGECDYNDRKLYFEVTEKEDEEYTPTLTVNKSRVETDEEFILSVSQPDEERLGIFIEGENEPWYETDRYTFNASGRHNEAGSYTYTLGVWYAGGWRLLSDVKGASVTVTVREKTVPEPEFTAPGANAKAGETIAFTASVDGAKTLNLMRNGVKVDGISAASGELKDTVSTPGVFTYTLEALDGDGKPIQHGVDPIEIVVTMPGTPEDGLTVNKLPARLGKIEEEAFSGSAFKAIEIPKGCTAIGPKAFANCKGLQVVVIPRSVTDIAPDAFEGCENLVKIDRKR